MENNNYNAPIVKFLGCSCSWFLLIYKFVFDIFFKKWVDFLQFVSKILDMTQDYMKICFLICT